MPRPERRRPWPARIGSLLMLILAATSCGVERDGFTAVGIDADGGLIGMIQMCGHHIDAATLYRSDPDHGPTLGEWDSAHPVTGFTRWSLAAPRGDWSSTASYQQPKGEGSFSLYGGTHDNSWSTHPATFTVAAIASLRPGDVVQAGGRVTTEADFRAHACDT